MIALFDKRQNSVCDSRRTAGEQRTACAAFQFAHRILQRKMGQRTAATVKQFAFRAVAGSVLFGLDGFKNQRGGALDNAIYRTLSILFTPSSLDKRGIKMFLCHVR
ncbi:hypothetical protein D3C78_748050 [compost metagenome]